MFKRNISLTGLFFLVISSLWAQMPTVMTGKIAGTVKDQTTKKAVEYATVSLFKGDQMTTGTLTDKNGEFILENVQPGKYSVRISFIGYGSVRKDSITLYPSGDMQVNLGLLFLKPSDKNLNVVEIQGEKDLITLDIDKKVYDVEKNITNTGGSASDVLSNIPSVNVDIEGNISLRGSEGVIILIDGKPSGISGPNRKAVLDGLPASAIESVEIITNPSSKYDADGMSGIINIKLKKDRRQGINGSAALSAGTRDKYNGTVSFNYRNKKVNFFTNYSYRYNNSYNFGNSLNTFLPGDTTYFINQQTQGLRKGGNHFARMGIDFYPNMKNTFSLSGSLGYNYSTGLTTHGYFFENINREAQYLNERNATEARSGLTYDLSASWKYTFTKKGRELSAELSYSGSEGPENSFFENKIKTPDGQWTSNEHLLEKTDRFNAYGVTIAQADFTEPILPNLSLETGIKGTIRHNDNDFSGENFDYTLNEYRNNPNITNRFVYHEQVYAAYFSLAHVIKSKWGYKIGLRAEQTLINTDLVTTQEKNARNYLGLFPSAHISYKPKAGWELRLGYSRRINRPQFENLNPFSDFTDPINLRVGNPNLNPEYINSGEFNVSYTKGKHAVSGAIFYRYTQDVMSRFRNADPVTGTATVRFENVGHAQSAGFEFISRNELFKWWNITSNINLFYYKISAGNTFGDLNNNNIGGFGKIISNWKFLKGTEAQMTLGYWAPSAAAQGAAKAVWGIDVGIKRDFWKNRLSVNLAVTDIFDTRRFAVEARGEGFEVSFYRKRETRIATLTVTWKIGKQEIGGKKMRKEGGGGEMDEGL
jgi:outer membrane receptor protein involved in Fe transport